LFALPTLHTKADFSFAESRKGDSAKKKMAYALGNEISDLLVTTPPKGGNNKSPAHFWPGFYFSL